MKVLCNVLFQSIFLLRINSGLNFHFKASIVRVCLVFMMRATTLEVIDFLPLFLKKLHIQKEKKHFNVQLWSLACM